MLATLKRRSLSLDDIVRTTGVSREEAKKGLDRLVKEGDIRLARFNNEWFYVAKRKKTPRERKGVPRCHVGEAASITAISY